MDKVCGLDVHKDSVFVCILNEKGEKILEERYGTLTPELDRLREALIKICLSKTGRLRTALVLIPVYQTLALLTA